MDAISGFQTVTLLSLGCYKYPICILSSLQSPGSSPPQFRSTNNPVEEAGRAPRRRECTHSDDKAAASPGLWHVLLRVLIRRLT